METSVFPAQWRDTIAGDDQRGDGSIGWLVRGPFTAAVPAKALAA
jgi:hypothetical protein